MTATESAYAYVRVSSNGQAQEDRDGFPRQIAAVEQYAPANSLRIEQTFTDAITGKTEADDRPAFVDMLAKCETTGVKIILVENLGRLARALIVQETIIGDLQRRGIKLLSTQEPDLDSNDPSRVLIRQFLGALHQYERSMIVSKLKGARERARKKNPTTYREGKRPFGALPGEHETVTRMRELKTQGKTLRDICAVLEAEGRKPRASEHWHAATVQRIIDRV
jgi:DNA invertase Pin-like site-specific DNA recombinase